MSENCKKKTCAGGYNCKYGSPLQELIVCESDLKMGICLNDICKLQHLTKRGLKCHQEQYNITGEFENVDDNKQTLTIEKEVLLNDSSQIILNKSLSSSLSFIGIILFGISDCLFILNYIKYSNLILEIIVLSFYWLGLTFIGWSICEKGLTEINLLEIN